MRRAHGARRAVRAGAAVLLLTGCYRFTPVEPGMLRTDDEVRLHLTREGMIDLPDLPRQSGATIGGRFAGRDDGRLLLRVPVAERTDGIVTRSVRQEVPIAAAQVVQMERRELDRLRTGFAVGGVLLGGLAIAAGFAGLGSPSPEQPTPPVDEEAGVRAIFRLTLPVP